MHLRFYLIYLFILLKFLFKLFIIILIILKYYYLLFNLLFCFKFQINYHSKFN